MSGNRCKAVPALTTLLFSRSQAGANAYSCIWVDRAFVVLNVLNLAFLVDDESCPPGPFVTIPAHWILLENSVFGENRAVHIAEQRKGDADLLRESRICRRAIRADAKHNRTA